MSVTFFFVGSDTANTEYPEVTLSNMNAGSVLTELGYQDKLEAGLAGKIDSEDLTLRIRNTQDALVNSKQGHSEDSPRVRTADYLIERLDGVCKVAEAALSVGEPVRFG